MRFPTGSWEQPLCSLSDGLRRLQSRGPLWEGDGDQDHRAWAWGSWSTWSWSSGRQAGVSLPQQ